MAKKADVVGGFAVQWEGNQGEENIVQGELTSLTDLSIADAPGSDTALIIIAPDEDGGVTVTVGSIVIAVRRPTTAEKRQGWTDPAVIEVQAGLDGEDVILSEECGAALLTDENSDEAE